MPTSSFGSRAALAGVSLSASRGVTTILGPNGAGKTSLLRALATVQPLDAGRITIDGLDATDRHQRVEIRRRLGYLPQDIGVLAARQPRSMSSTTCRCSRVGAILVLGAVRCGSRSTASGCASRAGDRVGTLSGGLRQRLGLAQAIFGSPPLIVLDEPSTGFDPAQRLELRTLLSELARRSTIVVSTHQTDDAAVCSDVVFVLDGGELRFSGTPAQLAVIGARSHLARHHDDGQRTSVVATAQRRVPLHRRTATGRRRRRAHRRGRLSPPRRATSASARRCEAAAEV